MNKDLTEIVVVLDRSGSMSSCQKDAEGGLNTFIEEQKKQPGRANFTLAQFDNLYELVHNAVPIADVPHCKVVPRGSTALLDAVGRTIVEVGSRLSNTPEHERPGLVVFAILTDGYENASREFTNEKIKEMIEHQTKAYNWQFTYLGANQDAFAVGGAMGIPTNAVGNFEEKTAGVVYGAVHKNVARMRAASAKGLSPKNAYTDEERVLMAGKKDPDPGADAMTKK